MDLSNTAARAAATLHGPLLSLLRESPQGMKIHNLVTALIAHDEVDLAFDSLDPMATFRVNFLVMNALFSLQNAMEGDRYGLEISTMMVRLYPRHEGATSQALDVHANASLRDYYLDWSHLENTTEAEVEAMLDAFWKRYWSQDRAEEAYAVLGLEPGADEQQIKQAFRRLAARHHPDKGGEAERFLAIREAYENLLRR